MTRALVALGANLPPRHETILSAVAALDHLPSTRVLSVSTLRETAPVDAPPGSPPFLNGACLLATELGPRELLAELLAVEARHGRVRDVPNAPRSLDLDLVLHGSCVVDEAGLTVPHPRAHERPFVLEPAAELAPDWVHPRLGRTLADLLAAAPADPGGGPPAGERSRAAGTA